MSFFSPYRTISHRRNIEFTSPGEELWYSMRNLFVKSQTNQWDDQIFNAVAWAEPSGALALFLSNIAVSSVHYRLIKATGRFAKLISPNRINIRDDAVEAEILRELQQYCVESLGFGYDQKGVLENVSNCAFASYLVTSNDISVQDARFVCEKEKNLHGNISCYICDAILFSKINPVPLTKIPLDHIWPRSLGGVSTPENLLPICEDCNTLKGDRISWDVFGVVQDVTHAINGNNAQSILQQALHRRAAVKIAEDKNITLKAAFKSLKGRTPLTLLSTDEPRTFFNLSAHNTAVLPSLWEI